ncbi:MAG: alkaline shock response membrane anchor protein AmaP [Actinomycetota bacterium]|nr:alkaline shock response membrane anchor protein AmaP [Actinomycetota bacterium]
MRVFNRVVVVLLLAGLFALGVATVLYSFDIANYRLEDLPRTLGLDRFYEGLRIYVENIESGTRLIFVDFILLVGIALLGLVLLVLELKPPAPRRIRMQEGTYITRRAVENEVVEAVEKDPEVLQSNVKVKARRRPGAKIDVRASVRSGEDVQGIQSGVQDRVQRRLAEMGLPAGDLKVRVIESDPRETKTRVK